MYQNQEKISLESLIEQIPERSKGIDCTGLSGADRAYLACRIYKKLKAPVIAIVASTKEAEAFLEDLLFFSKKTNTPIIYFPPYNILPFKDFAYHSETAAKRIRTLYRLITDAVPMIVVTTVDALLHKIIPKQEIINYAELIEKG